MSFQSKTQPLCRACGKPIRKRTRPVFFSRENAPITSKEAQRRVNERIVWASYTTRPDGSRYVGMVTVWDGESWEDEFFCTIRCAQLLGLVMAKEGRCLRPYNDSLTRRAKRLERLK